MEMMMRARKRSKEQDEQTSERFRQILGIVRKHSLREGLTPQKAVALLEDLGATFVKLGQIASTHPDMLPPEYCEAFGQLRSKATPLPFEEVKTQVEAQLGKPLDEVFEEFDEKPAGSASIAQVHRAKLKDGGADVAVKVQRPGVVEQVTSDLAIMERMVALYGLVDSKGGLSVKDLVAEMVRTSTEELDFTNEAGNLIRFHKNNAEREGVLSPQCYQDLCTSAILVEDFVTAPCVELIDQMKLKDGSELSESDREKLAYLVASNYMKQIMEDGFYHADPHAGNVCIVNKTTIEWIDFGMMGQLTSSQRDTIQELINALVKGNAYALKRAVLKIATPTGPVDHSDLLETCERMMDQFVSVDLESFDTGALINSFSSGLRESGYDIDPFMVNLGRGLVTLEGTINLISPRLNISKVLQDYMRSSFDLKHVERQVRKNVNQMAESAEAMAELPAQASETLDMIQKGHLKVGLNVSADGELMRTLRGLVGFLSLAAVAMGMIIGSCILGADPTGPRINGIPVMGLAGIAIGTATIVYILVKVRKYLK